MQIDREKLLALLDAIRPFAHAAGLGWQVKEAVRKADLRGQGLSKLIAADAYAGVHTAQSNVSWVDWQRLHDEPFGSFEEAERWRLERLRDG